MSESNLPAVQQAAGLTATRFREATDVASVCRDIVTKTAVQIGSRNYVRVEGWTSIAVAHGCIASVKPGSVREILRDGKVVGFEAIGQVRRQSDGVVLAEAEGYVGNDEETWFGSNGEKRLRYSKVLRGEIDTPIPKREDYAIRSMAQTRAISKVCRNAFSHVVVMMNAGLSTTPYEEVSDPGEDGSAPEAPKGGAPATEKKDPPPAERRAEKAPASGTKTETKREVEVPRDASVGFEAQFRDGRWKEVVVHFGTNKDKKLGDLSPQSLSWYCWKWECGARREPTEDDKILRAACNVAIEELGLQEPSR